MCSFWSILWTKLFKIIKQCRLFLEKGSKVSRFHWRNSVLKFSFSNMWKMQLKKKYEKLTSGLYVDTDAKQLYLTKALASFQRYLNSIFHCLNSTFWRMTPYFWQYFNVCNWQCKHHFRILFIISLSIE